MPRVGRGGLPGGSCRADLLSSPLLPSHRLLLLGLLAGLAAGILAMTCGAPPPLAIAAPGSGAKLSSSDPLTIRIRYNNEAMPLSADGTVVQLKVHLNGEPVAIEPAVVEANQTIVTVSGARLQPGRNFITAYVPSTNEEALLHDLNPNDDLAFLVRHRVFFADDQDGDGIPNGSDDPADDVVDSDGDGLLDSVEAPGTGISGTVASGAIAITAIRPDPIIPGRAVALLGAGLEAIESPDEVSFDGLSAVHLATPSPTSLIVQPPHGLGPGVVGVALQDATGLSAGPVPPVAGTVHVAAAPALQNLVMISSPYAQAFFDAAGELDPEREHNIPLFLNMLQNGSFTRVLVDASKVDPAAQPMFTPDLETMFALHAGVGATTRLAGALSPAVLEEVDLLFLLITQPVAFYSQAEIDAVAAWTRVPGHRLVVVSSSCCDGFNFSNLIANTILQAVGADSHFDTSFPVAAQQHDEERLAGVAGHFFVPPFTDGVDVVAYRLPTQILLGVGGSEIARAGICLAGEITIEAPSPDPAFPSVLVGCQDPETEEVLGVIQPTYVATESVPTDEPFLQIASLAPGPVLDAQTAIGIPGNGFVPLTPTDQVTVEAKMANLPATQATFRLGTAVQTVPVAPVDGVPTATATLPVPPTGDPLAVQVSASAGAASAEDAIVVRLRRQSARVRFTVFSDAAGAPAIEATALAATQRQAGLELEALCSSANGVSVTDPATGIPLPGLSPTLRFEDTPPSFGNPTEPLGFDLVQNPAGFGLVLTRDGSFSTEVARMVLEGTRPDTGDDPMNEIPDPVMSGSAAVRVFVAKTFTRHDSMDGEPGMDRTIPQDAQTGISQFGQAFFQVPLQFEGIGQTAAGSDALVIQAQSGDLEAGPLRVDRPVASSLLHELVHVLGGVQDTDPVQVSDPPPTGTVEVPAVTDPGVMNSFPFFRALRMGQAAAVDCRGESLVPDTQSLCERIVNGYTCESTIDFTE